MPRKVIKPSRTTLSKDGNSANGGLKNWITLIGFFLCGAYIFVGGLNGPVDCGSFLSATDSSSSSNKNTQQSSSQGSTTTSTSSTSSTTTSTTKQSSRYATVMGMATGYDVKAYKRFVGTLRGTGYEGHIILVISPDPQPGVPEYLASQNVTTHALKKVPCTHGVKGMDLSNPQVQADPHTAERLTCAHPYPQLKARWGRFALLRDYLQDCTSCTGPVLVADVRDMFFQRDPFGPEAPPVKGLQLFEEAKRQRTTHWLVQQPVELCKGRKIFDEVMLCSGTTIGTRAGMLHYLNVMVDEMTEWMSSPKCCCSPMSGDDQAIHNSLHYGDHKFGTPDIPVEVVANREGLVYTVGVQASFIHIAKRDWNKDKLNMTIRQALEAPYTPQKEHDRGNWLPPEFDMTDEQGWFRNSNWERSFIVHQYDRFGQQVEEWMFSKHGPCKHCGVIGF